MVHYGESRLSATHRHLLLEPAWRAQPLHVHWRYSASSCSNCLSRRRVGRGPSYLAILSGVRGSVGKCTASGLSWCLVMMGGDSPNESSLLGVGRSEEHEERSSFKSFESVLSRSPTCLFLTSSLDSTCIHRPFLNTFRTINNTIPPDQRE